MRYSAWDLRKAQAYYKRFTTDVTIEKDGNYYILKDHFTGWEIGSHDLFFCMKKYNYSVPYNWNNDPQLVEMFGPCPSDWDHFYDPKSRFWHTLTVDGKLVGSFENPRDDKAYTCRKYSVRKVYTAIVDGVECWCKVCHTGALTHKAANTPNIPHYKMQENGIIMAV